MLVTKKTGYLLHLEYLNSMTKLNELTLVEALAGLKSHKFTSVELTQACIDHISKHNASLNVFITIQATEVLLKLAQDADELIQSQGDKAFDMSPLLGVPYVCKDNFSTEGIETTASSNILKGYIPPYESTVTKKLKDAGAILLGKSNMDAFAHGSSTETSDFGTTLNPWDSRVSPGGSSGGSAAAVAANMCIFAIGSETAGSIRGPASWCGVTGFKPTYGRVSRYGVIAMASSTDSPGPITKTVEDSAVLMELLAGKDICDATTTPKPVDKYAENLNKLDMKDITIGVAKSYFVKEIRPDVAAKVKEAIDKFKELGAKIVEIDLMDPKYSIAVYTIVQRSEVSSNLARFDGIRFGHSRQSFGHEARKRMMLGAYALSSGYYDAYYSKAQKVRTLIIEDFNRVFEKVDLIIGPTLHDVAIEAGTSEKISPLFGELMDMLLEPSAVAGLTAISIPCGLVKGDLGKNLPVGLQLIGPQLAEQKVLSVAHQFQVHTDFHKVFPDLDEVVK